MEDLVPKSPAPEENEDKAAENGRENGGLVTWVKSLLPAKSVNDDDSLRDAIEELIEEDGANQQSAVARHERKLISNILLQLRDLPVAKRVDGAARRYRGH